MSVTGTVPHVSEVLNGAYPTNWDGDTDSAASRNAIFDALQLFILRTILNENTILFATVDDTPAALAVDEERIVGRITGGNITDLTDVEVRGLINVEDGATADQTGLEIVTLLEALAAAARLSHDAGLSDVSPDDHHPQAHNLASHSTKAHNELTGVTSDQHHAQAHAGDHVDGTDDIQDATAVQKGLATLAQIAKLDGIEALATADQTGLEIVVLLQALLAANRLDHGAGLSGLGDNDHTQYMLNSVANANSMLYSILDNTPAALAVAASRIIGRGAAGNIAALTGAQILAILTGQAGAAFSFNSQAVDVEQLICDTGNNARIRLPVGVGLFD